MWKINDIFYTGHVPSNGRWHTLSIIKIAFQHIESRFNTAHYGDTACFFPSKFDLSAANTI